MPREEKAFRAGSPRLLLPLCYRANQDGDVLMVEAKNTAPVASPKDRRFTHGTLIAIPCVTTGLLFALFYPPEALPPSDRIEAGYGEYVLFDTPETDDFLDMNRIQDLEDELERRIQSIAPFIRSAHVSIRPRLEAGVQLDWNEPSISVNISSDRVLTEDNVEVIQQFISSVVDGVEAQSVIVLSQTSVSGSLE